MCGGSRERSLRSPLSDQFDLRITQPALLREIPITFFRLPGRHDSPFRYIHDLRGVPFTVVVCEEREWRRLARPVAGRALPIHDGRDVPVEGDLRRRWSRIRDHRGNHPQQTESRTGIHPPGYLAERENALGEPQHDSKQQVYIPTKALVLPYSGPRTASTRSALTFSKV